MNYVEKLLKGRKAGAELELSHCDPENPDYDESRANRIEEINQIEQALLILHNVSKSSTCENCDGWGYTVDENGRRDKHCNVC